MVDSRRLVARAMWRESRHFSTDRWCEDARRRVFVETGTAPIARAGATQHQGGIQRQSLRFHVIAAFKAMAEPAAVTARRRGEDTAAFGFSSAAPGFGQGLLLQGIHARHPANRLLVQHHRPAPFGRSGLLVLERPQALGQRAPVICHREGWAGGRLRLRRIRPDRGPDTTGSDHRPVGEDGRGWRILLDRGAGRLFRMFLACLFVFLCHNHVSTMYTATYCRGFAAI